MDCSLQFMLLICITAVVDQGKNSYLFHRIIDSFPRILKSKIIRLKPVWLGPSCRKPELTKMVLILLFVENHL